MSTPTPRPQVGDQITGEQLDALPVGSAVVLAVDGLDRAVPAPPSALLRFADGWRGADRTDTGPPNVAARYRVLFTPPQ